MTSPDLDLAPERRDRIVAGVRSALEDAVVASSFVLRGSLAEGTADRYSDIDAIWRVPDGRRQSALDALPEVLHSVARVFSVRVDPDSLAADSCLVFVTFTDVPMFWRLDLLIETVTGDLDTPLEVATEWSLPESALANAVAAVRAVVRGRDDDATGLLDRGYPRVGATYTPSGSWQYDIVGLAIAAARADSRLELRSERVRKIAEALLL
jgi:hypothetical protein